MFPGRRTVAWIPTLGSILVGAALLVSGPAYADDSHYQDFIIGGRAMALGGAYTSIADEPSGLFYNPAGIADVRRTNYQVSTSLYGFERGGYGGGSLILPVAGLEDLKVEFTDLVIVPASAGFVSTFGANGPDGKPVNSYALSIVVPSFRSFGATDPLGDDDLAIQSQLLSENPPTYSRRHADRTLWTGLGYGRRIGQYLRVGVSGFYIFRSTEDVEQVNISATIQDGDPDPSNDQQLFQIARNEINFVNGALVFVAGAKLELPHGIRVGASFQTPSIQLHSHSSLRFTTGESIPSCGQLNLSPQRQVMCQQEALLADPRSVFESRAFNGTSETQYPATLRIGGSYAAPYQFTVAADMAIHFPTSYQLIKSEELTDELRSRIPFNPDVVRNTVVNFNIGAEYLVVREVSVAAGFYSDFSSAPAISRAPTRDSLPRVDMRGLTLTLGYFSKHSLSRIGVLYTWGDGHDVIPTSDVARLLRSRQAFKRVDYFQSFFYIFLSSTFRY